MLHVCKLAKPAVLLAVLCVLCGRYRIDLCSSETFNIRAASAFYCLLYIVIILQDLISVTIGRFNITDGRFDDLTDIKE